MTQLLTCTFQVPAPGFPHTPVEYRKGKPGEWWWDGYRWLQLDPLYGATSAPHPITTRISLPDSVPGFKKGLWFYRGPGGTWFWTLEKPRLSESEGYWFVSYDCWLVQREGMTAHDFLSTFNSISWEQSLFQTTKDG